jgi:acyl dehydratase
MTSPHPTPTRLLHWEDFPAGLVMDVGRTPPVTREAVLDFARQFDPQPFHLDDAAAEASLFGKLAASGWHTAAMVMRVMCDGYLNASAGLGSPGVENLRWVKPVYPGDVLHVRMEVLEARASKSKPTLGLVRSSWTVTNQDDETVMTMEGWGLFARRTPGGGSGDETARGRPGAGPGG